MALSQNNYCQLKAYKHILIVRRVYRRRKEKLDMASTNRRSLIKSLLAGSVSARRAGLQCHHTGRTGGVDPPRSETNHEDRRHRPPHKGRRHCGARAARRRAEWPGSGGCATLCNGFNADGLRRRPHRGRHSAGRPARAENTSREIRGSAPRGTSGLARPSCNHRATRRLQVRRVGKPLGHLPNRGDVPPRDADAKSKITSANAAIVRASGGSGSPPFSPKLS